MAPFLGRFAPNKVVKCFLPMSVALAVMNKSSQKLKMGFRLGIYTKEEVIDWVVVEIDQSDEPSEKLLDLSFATTKGVHDIYSALCDLDGSPEEDDVLIEVLTDLEDQVIDNIEFCRDLAIKLYSYYIDKNYEVDQRLTEIGYFDDGYDLALRGICLLYTSPSPRDS